jgi:hypothetical protein
MAYKQTRIITSVDTLSCSNSEKTTMDKMAIHMDKMVFCRVANLTGRLDKIKNAIVARVAPPG